MKLLTSLKNFVAYSLVLLVIVSSLLLTSLDALADSVGFGATHYLAFVDTTTQTQDVDSAIASYRTLKVKVSKKETLKLDEIKEVLGAINAQINALVKNKKDLLATDPSTQTEDIDSAIASYRSIKAKVSKNSKEGELTLDEIKVVLKAINAQINALVEQKNNPA